MKVSRIFNLTNLGLKYESITIEIEGSDMNEIILEIENSFRTYCESIKRGLVS